MCIRDRAKKYEASETEDISQIKEALAKESTAAMAETTKKNTTKKGKKGAIDVKDGTYKGSANGYGGKVTVNVTVSKKTMTAIDAVSYTHLDVYKRQEMLSAMLSLTRSRIK